MNNTDLQIILKKHQLWLDGEPGGKRANLAGVDLGGVNLTGANLARASLAGTNLTGATLEKINLADANLRGANLIGADLVGATLEGANLFKAWLFEADLIRANLREATLRKAYLEQADLEEANFRDANLTDANLKNANLEGANLYKTNGLLSAIDFLAENFEKTPDGYIVYKTFGMYYSTRTDWTIEKDGIIEDIVDLDRRTTCGYGINVATKDWIKREAPKINKVWKCLIKWEWLPGVVVPYATDGKIRCERLMLLEKVDI